MHAAMTFELVQLRQREHQLRFARHHPLATSVCKAVQNNHAPHVLDQKLADVRQMRQLIKAGIYKVHAQERALEMNSSPSVY